MIKSKKKEFEVNLPEWKRKEFEIETLEWNPREEEVDENDWKRTYGSKFEVPSTQGTFRSQSRWTSRG